MNPGPFVAFLVCTAVWVAGLWAGANVVQWVTSGGLSHLSDQGAAMVFVVAIGLFTTAAAVVSLVGGRR